VEQYSGLGPPPYSHKEVLADGARLDVQARLACTGDTKFVIGIYEPSGLARVKRLTPGGPARRLRGPWPGAREEAARLLTLEQ